MPVLMPLSMLLLAVAQEQVWRMTRLAPTGPAFGTRTLPASDHALVSVLADHLLFFTSDAEIYHWHCHHRFRRPLVLRHGRPVRLECSLRKSVWGMTTGKWLSSPRSFR